MSHSEPGLDNRYRDDDGRIRVKNGNTRIDTLRVTYGQEFAEGYRGDIQLEKLLEREGVSSLSEYLRTRHKK